MALKFVSFPGENTSKQIPFRLWGGGEGSWYTCSSLEILRGHPGEVKKLMIFVFFLFAIFSNYIFKKVKYVRNVSELACYLLLFCGKHEIRTNNFFVPEPEIC